LSRLIRFSGSVIAGAAVALLGAATLIFLAIHLVPGSYTQAVVPLDASPQARAAATHELGLDQPLPVQFAKWLGALVRGDLGDSLLTHASVRSEIVSHAPPTIELTLLATLFSVLVGVPLGAIAALRSDRRFAPVVTRTLSSMAIAVPAFVLGTAIAYLASLHVLGLDIGVYAPLSADAGANLNAVLFPSLVLGVFTVGLVARTTRDSVLGVLTQPFITAAAARGESRRQIVRRHVLRNSLIPIVTVVAVNVGYLLGGAVIIEQIFSIPGLGQYALLAIQHRDYPQVQGVVVIGTLVFILLNLLADLAYALIDPRISLSGSVR
jgi:peptide/nickel transport system permease protein